MIARLRAWWKWLDSLPLRWLNWMWPQLTPEQRAKIDRMMKRNADENQRDQR